MLKTIINEKQIICKAETTTLHQYIGKLIVDYNKIQTEETYTINGGETHSTLVDKFDLTISGWYVEESFKHQGWGKKMLREVFKAFKKSDIHSLKYIWNGTNSYVGEWLKQFDAECICPLAVLKTTEIDSWESHIYVLNVDKFMNYIEGINL